MSFFTNLTFSTFLKICSTHFTNDLKHKHLLLSEPFKKSNRKSRPNPLLSALIAGLFWRFSDPKKDINFTDSSRSKDNFIVQVTRKCCPAVVYIEIKDPKKIAPETGLFSFFKI